MTQNAAALRELSGPRLLEPTKMATEPKALEDTSFPLASLPDDILAQVIDHLSSDADRMALRSVCRQLRALVDSKVSSLELFVDDTLALNNLDQVAARWPALRVLHLSGLPSAAGPALGRATFASLEELWLKEREIAPDAVVDLSTAVAKMSKLRVLDLARTHLAGVQALARVECPSLEDINLANNELGPDSVNEIAEASSKWPNLRILYLNLNPQLGAAGAEALCRAAFPCMEELCLGRCGLGPDGAQSLASSATQWPRLRVLSGFENALGDEGVAALLAAPLPALEELSLERNGIGEQGAAAIAAASSRLPNLRYLGLSLNALGDSGARALAQAHFPRLQSLNLRGNNIGAEGKAALDAARTRWPKLRELEF